MNPPLIFALRAESESPTLSQALAFQSAGLIVVLASLGMLAILLAVLGRVFQAGPAPKPHTTPSTRAVEPVPPEIKAVIAAAVACTVHETHRITEIRPASNRWVQAWSIEGRRQIFQSHQVR